MRSLLIVPTLLVMLSSRIDGSELANKRFRCQYSLRALVATSLLLGVGMGAYLGSGDEIEVTITPLQKAILKKRFKDYTSKEELRRDLKTVYPYLFDLMRAQRYRSENTSQNLGVEPIDRILVFSTGEEFLGDIVLGSTHPVAEKWRARAPQYGVMLPSQSDYEASNKRHGIAPGMWQAYGVALHDKGTIPAKSTPGFEEYLIGFLTDWIWDHSKLHWGNLGQSLYPIAPGAGWGETLPGKHEARVRDLKNTGQRIWESLQK